MSIITIKNAINEWIGGKLTLSKDYFKNDD